MNTTASAPGSPPDLSGSRSSKSSSYCSTSDSPEGLASDITNFEDIGLEDDRNGAQDSGDKSIIDLSPKIGRVSKHTVNSSKSDAQPPLPALRSQVREAVRQQVDERKTKSQPQIGAARRGFTSPIPIFPPANAENARTRSSSPLRRTAASASTGTLSTGSLRPDSDAHRSSLPARPRRGSWQPQRKSVQELEDEYHDSDDELPEDASLWNVPLSPYPSANRSARSSFHGSPIREPILSSPGPIPLAHAKTAPDSPPRSGPYSQSLPKSRPLPPRSTSLNAPFSNPSSPRSPRSMRTTRAKSWNLAMADLSEEARVISQTLEFHADAEGRARGDGVDDELRDASKPNTRRSQKANTIQLPPLQKGNLDFMPISKEKEAILSRTRPSWLPPKNPKEEKRHLKEYQRMMAASMEAEKKKRDKVQSQQCLEDGTRAALNRIWQYYVAESTDLSTMDTRVYDLCWRGVSPKLRGKVWQRAIANPLGLTRTSYERALTRAKTIRAQSREQLSALERNMERWFTDIERDAETAFPDLKLFQRGGPLWQDLIDVCEAYACYRSDVGYVYGFQLMSALLLLQVSTPEDAFILLANCLNRPVPLAFQTGDIQTTSRTYNHAVSTLAIKFPCLHEYLFGSIEQGGLGFAAEEILEPMFRTMFCNGLDVDRLCRIWDIWMFEGDKTLVRAGVALLGGLQTQIFEIGGDVDLKRRNVQEMLGWGPFNRTSHGGHWILDIGGDEDRFIEDIRLAGQLDYRGK